MIGVMVPSVFAFEYKLTDNFFITYDQCEMEVNADNELMRIVLSKLLNEQINEQSEWGICNLLGESRFEYTSSDSGGIKTIKLKDGDVRTIRFLNDGKNDDAIPIVLPKDWIVGDSVFSIKYNGIKEKTINNQLIKVYEFEDVNYKEIGIGAAEIISKLQYDTNSGFLVSYYFKGSMGMVLLDGGNMSIKLDATDISKKIICGKGTIEKNSQCVVDISKQKSSKGGGCLIATATYGSEMATEVQQLRELRDYSLLQTKSGTSFINTFNDVYYSFSPYIADYERENYAFKELVKLTITPMISSLSILNYVDLDSENSVLGYGISLILLNLTMYVGIPIVAIIGIRKKF